MSQSKFDVIMHPVRMRILTILAGERQFTASQLALALPDVPQATLYRHIRALADNDIIIVVEERPVRGTVEKVYTLPQMNAQIGPEALQDLSKADHMRYFTAFTTTLLAQYERYLEQTAEPNLVTDGVGYRTVPLYISDVELQNFSLQLNALLLPLLENKPGPGRKRRYLSTVLMPAVDEPPTSDASNTSD